MQDYEGMGAVGKVTVVTAGKAVYKVARVGHPHAR